MKVDPVLQSIWFHAQFGIKLLLSIKVIRIIWQNNKQDRELNMIASHFVVIVIEPRFV